MLGDGNVTMRRATQGVSQEQFLAQLGKPGLDLAMWEKASSG